MFIKLLNNKQKGFNHARLLKILFKINYRERCSKIKNLGMLGKVHILAAVKLASIQDSNLM